MPRDPSTHTIETTLYVEINAAGVPVEVLARLSFTYHPGDQRPPRPTDIDPPEPETIEDVRLEVLLGQQDGARHWRRLKDSTLEARLLQGIDHDLAAYAQDGRQAEYEAAREPE